jgi:hypothetical protein
MVDHSKKETDEREKKAKANMKVMAKIAYKEWKERKAEEKRQQAKQERMERRNRMMEFSQGKERKGEVMLAYGLNKNLKQLRERPKSAKPLKKKGKKARQQIQFE